MTIALYKNSAPPNKVNKASNLSKKTIFEGMHFVENGALDVLNPSCLIEYTDDIADIVKFNYMYIPKLKRYYFIDSIKSEGGLIRIDGRCDVLMSHKDDILASTQYIIRQEKKNNSPYLEDSLLPISSQHNTKGRKLTGRKVSDVTCGRVILATTGKGGTPI